ncbi:MAG: oligosaccharide flippase family protein [Desulfobacterales bacterium]|jgi:O-antigen/teichoic acid export membrane protein|nr:oligosaccharide flippase family protein [Desulfobacterales bacterium]
MTHVASEIQGQRERRLGAAFGLVYVISSLSSKLLIIPIILRHLDSAEFGLYQLIGAFVGYLALIDFGISGTLGRFTAKYQALNDRVRQDNVFAMCIIIYVFLAAVISVVGFFLYLNLDTIFSKSLTSNEMADARVMFMILLGSICATIIGRAFIGVNAGHERFVFSRITDSVCMWVKVGVVAAVLALGHRAIGIVIAEAFINVAILALNAAYAGIVLKVRFKLHYWDWSLFGEVLGFAFWAFLAMLVLQINFRLGSILLGAMTTTSLVGIYAIALQVNTIYNTLPSMISSVFLPRITRLVVEDADGELLTRAIIGPSRYQLMLVGCVLGGFILFGRQFISLWAGPEYVGAWATALFIVAPVTIPICQNTILSILYAKMLNRDRALITLAFAVISGVSAVFLIRAFGLYGPAIATGLALLIGHGVVMNLYYHYYVGLNMWLFFKKVSERILTVIVAVTVVGAALVYLPVGEGWVGLTVRLILFLILYALSMWLFGMNESERALFRSAFQAGIRVTFAVGGGEVKAR